jgi:hypothetical protein
MRHERTVITELYPRGQTILWIKLSSILETLITSKAQGCITVNQKSYLVVVGTSSRHRESIKVDLTKLTLRYETVVYSLIVVSLGDLNEGKSPVWITQLGFLDKAQDLAANLTRGLGQQEEQRQLPKFNLYQIKKKV